MCIHHAFDALPTLDFAKDGSYSILVLQPSSFLFRAHARARVPLFLVVSDLELFVFLSQIVIVLLQILALFV